MPISNTYSILGNDAFSVKHFVMTDIGQHVMAAESVVVLVEKPAIGRNFDHREWSRTRSRTRGEDGLHLVDALFQPGLRLV